MVVSEHFRNEGNDLLGQDHVRNGSDIRRAEESLSLRLLIRSNRGITRNCRIWRFVKYQPCPAIKLDIAVTFALYTAHRSVV